MVFTNSSGTETDVNRLEQRVFVIYNAGSADILEPIDISLNLTHFVVGEYEKWYGKTIDRLWGKTAIGKTQEMEKVGENSHHFHQWTFDKLGCEANCDSFDDGGSSAHIELRIPYLNSYQEHQDYQILRLIADGNYVYSLDSRVGKGWSAKYVPQRVLRITWDRTRIPLRLIGLMLLVVMLTVIMADALLETYGPESVIWGSNLVEESIASKIQECRQNSADICYRYGRQLTEFSNRGFLGRILYLAELSFSTVIGTRSGFYVFLLLYILATLLLAMSNRLASWFTNMRYGIRSSSNFSWR